MYFIKKVKALIGGNPELVNARDKSGWTPLYWAVSNGNMKMTRFFISKRADVNVKANMGETPLHMANSLEIVKFLISKGADINAKDGGGVTALSWAMIEGNEELVNFLISEGARGPEARVMKIEDSDSKWN